MIGAACMSRHKEGGALVGSAYVLINLLYILAIVLNNLRP